MTASPILSSVWDAGNRIAPTESMQKRLHVLFSGTVQGIGFRFTTERMARRYPVTGYVHNLPKGQVEVLAEGEEKSLEEFLKAIQEAFQSYIQNVDVRWGKATREFKAFGIRF